MTHPSGTLGFSHLFSTALVEFALHLASLQYLGKAKVELVSKILCAAHSDVMYEFFKADKNTRLQKQECLEVHHEVLRRLG